MSFRVGNDIVIDETDVTADVRSEIIDITNIYGFSMQSISTGTVSATLKVEVSNNKTDWVELSSPTTTILNVSNAVAEKPDTFYKWMRFFVDFTSGTTNTVKVYMTTKGFRINHGKKI